MGMGLVQIREREKISLSNGFQFGAKQREAGKEAPPWVWVGMEVGEASTMEVGGELVWWFWRSMVMGSLWWSSWGLTFMMKVRMVGFDFRQ